MTVRGSRKCCHHPCSVRAVALWSGCKNSFMNKQTHVDSRQQTLDLAAFSTHVCRQGRLPGARQCGLQKVLRWLTPLMCYTSRHTCDEWLQLGGHLGPNVSYESTTDVVPDASMLYCKHAALPHLYGHESIIAAVIACSTISSEKYICQLLYRLTSVAVSPDRCLSKTRVSNLHYKDAGTGFRNAKGTKKE